MACITTYGVFMMVTKAPSIQFYQETSNVILVHCFHLFYILYNLKHMYVNFL